MKKISLFLLATFCCAFLFANRKIADIPYSNGCSDTYSIERCKLDIYVPENAKDCPVLVWFHGGGIASGDKRHIPSGVKECGKYITVSAQYRLSPKINAALAIEDAAAAVAWVFKNIEKYGGDKNKIFISGASAGGYLSGMLGFAPKYLARYGVKNTDLAGMILLSGQMTIHFRVRADSGDKSAMYAPKIDEYAVLGNVENAISPLCIIVGDRRIEWKGRVEENFLLAATVNALKTGDVEIYELQGLNHGTVANGFAPIAASFIDRILKKRNAK